MTNTKDMELASAMVRLREQKALINEFLIVEDIIAVTIPKLLLEALGEEAQNLPSWAVSGKIRNVKELLSALGGVALPKKLVLLTRVKNKYVSKMDLVIKAIENGNEQKYKQAIGAVGQYMDKVDLRMDSLKRNLFVALVIEVEDIKRIDPSLVVGNETLFETYESLITG